MQSLQELTASKKESAELQAKLNEKDSQLQRKDTEVGCCHQALHVRLQCNPQDAEGHSLAEAFGQCCWLAEQLSLVRASSGFAFIAGPCLCLRTPGRLSSWLAEAHSLVLGCVQMRNLQTDKRTLAKTLEVRQAELSEVNQRLRNALVGAMLYCVILPCAAWPAAAAICLLCASLVPIFES